MMPTPSLINHLVKGILGTKKVTGAPLTVSQFKFCMTSDR